MNRQINPKSIAPPAGNQADAVLAEAASRWPHTSGVVPTRPAGGAPGDIGEQADIVSITAHVVAGEPLGPVTAARDKFMGGRGTAPTLVTVPAPAQSTWKLEIAIVAAAG